ncbi:MAG: HK97 family phage prohead protease [Bacteroidales bacterium]|nr:HK97 family phage prohead protease [Bacteroidales bacterium]
MEQAKHLLYQTKATDVDEAQGIVTVAVNGIGIEDSQHDISMPGSFDITLKEDIGRMRWFLNHDTTQLLGVVLDGEEKDGNLVMVGKLNLEKQIGRDILADYKLHAENGRTLEHSIGVQAVKRDEEDPRKVAQWKMYEYSTLTSWGANPQTFLVGIKSATPDQVRETIAFLSKAARAQYSDQRLKTIEENIATLRKALDGENIVTCPYCGQAFDYNSQPEVSFTQQTLDTVANYIQWIAEDCVAQRMGELTPEIRSEVCAIIDARKAGDITRLTAKGILDIATYVRCPHCWSRVYRHDATLQADATPVEKSDTTPEQHAAETPDIWKSLSEIL